MKEIVSEILRKIKRILPNADYYVSPANDNVNDINIMSSHSNATLKGSRYYYKGTENFIHYTSIEAIQSIIESKSLRLFNLLNLIDPQELGFAGRMFYQTAGNLKDIKQNLFTISFCSDSLLTEDRHIHQFNQWRLYGRNGNGVCLVFSLQNDPIEWSGFHMSKVHYAKLNPKRPSGFTSLFKTTKRSADSGLKVDIDLAKLFCFHKSYLYNYEEEIRIIYDGRKTNTRVDVKKHFKNLNKDGISYIELPLVNDSPSTPLLKLEKIIIGFAIDLKTYGKMRKELKTLAAKHLGYEPEIKRSKLAFQYWGENK